MTSSSPGFPSLGRDMFFEFPFEYGNIPGIGELFYPVVIVELKTVAGWKKLEFLVDTGADITTLPSTFLPVLGLNKSQLKSSRTSGVGDIEVKTWEMKILLRLGAIELTVVGSAVDTNNKFSPLLLGRKDIFDGPFNLLLDSKRKVTIISQN